MNVSEDELHQRALAVPLQEIAWPAFNRQQLTLLVRRDDLIDPNQSGNKFYKLFYNLKAAKHAGFKQILSFGGAYSNHIYALAAAGRDAGLKTIGVIRGERSAQLSPTLRDAETCGMTLHFISRSDYRRKDELQFGQDLRDQLQQLFGDFYYVPEGGANELGTRGVAAIGWALEQQLRGNYDCVCVPCGTGSTLAGVAAGLPAAKLALGISVLKGDGELGAAISRSYRSCAAMLAAERLAIAEPWRLVSGYHGGGYGRKLPPELADFWHAFERDTGLLLDPVYTVKMFWAMAQLAEQGYWPKGQRIVAIHTGGLQGRRGFIDGQHTSAV